MRSFSEENYRNIQSLFTEKTGVPLRKRRVARAAPFVLAAAVLAALLTVPMDFTSEKAIGAEIEADFEQLKLTGGYDHNFILDKAVEGSIELMAVASCKESGITMEAFTDLPCVQFYAGNFIAPVTGKNGVFYDKRNGFCLESQYVPNAINQEGEEKPILEATTNAINITTDTTT